MRRLLYICILVLSAMSMMAENYASNARAEQVERTMVITYDLSKTANVRLLVSTNMSNDFKEVKKVTGAVGKNVQAGANRQITWNVLEEYDRFVADGVRFKVETYDEGGFSVSSSKKVTFSPGNLQYHPANNKWRFAENQTDYIGKANSYCSSRYNGWLDLFGWSTSATHFGVSTSTDYTDYSGSFVDWGRNKIGDDAPNTWRTLTKDEWYYLLNTRPNASSLKGVAQVNGVNGLILLPDNWTCPSGITFKSGYHSKWGIDNNYYAAYQTFTAAEWSKLEAAGAVFLPAAGNRYGSDVGNVQYVGVYWSATENSGYDAYNLVFRSDEPCMNDFPRYHGLSVRLVKDL